MKLWLGRLSFLPRRTMYSTGTMNIFDRETKRKQRNRAFLAKDAQTYDYIKDMVAETVVDRIADISRFFPQALDVGCGRGHIARAVSDDLIGSLYQCDMAECAILSGSGGGDDGDGDGGDSGGGDGGDSGGIMTHKLIADEEEGLPFLDETFDLVVSSLSLHWVNDLPGVMQEVWRVLKRDAPFIGVLFAGDTLYQLRTSLQLAEMERYSGFFPHISPFVELRDMGGLLTQAGYSLTTIDTDEVVVNYPSMFELMKDLQGMGESNCAWSRPLILRREAMIAASAIYNELYGNEVGVASVPATFQLLYFIGWKPHPSQATPLPRGSATASFKELPAKQNNNYI